MQVRGIPSEPAAQVQVVGVVFSDGLGGDAEVAFSGFTNESHQRFLTPFVQRLQRRLRCQQVIKPSKVRPKVGVEGFDVVSVELTQNPNERLLACTVFRFLPCLFSHSPRSS